MDPHMPYCMMILDTGKCARWVPKELTVVHKRQRVEVATQFVRWREEDLSILERTYR